VDLRSNIAAESRAKIVYEYLMQFTDDPHVKETLRFLMTREISHFKMFAAALETIQPNFPPCVLQGDPRFTHAYYNLSNGKDSRGPWNEGQGPWGEDEQWEYIEDPVAQVRDTEGQMSKKPMGTSHTEAEVKAMNKKMATMKSKEVKSAMPKGENQWSTYDDA
jgi:Mn-containing catalase